MLFVVVPDNFQRWAHHTGGNTWQGVLPVCDNTVDRSKLIIWWTRQAVLPAPWCVLLCINKCSQTADGNIFLQNQSSIIQLDGTGDGSSSSEDEDFDNDDNDDDNEEEQNEDEAEQGEEEVMALFS